MTVYVKRIADCKLYIPPSLQVDVSGFEANYTLNSIPTATVDVPVGREFRTELPSNSFALLSSLVIDRPCYLTVTFLDASEGYNLNPYLANGTYVVFAGYISNVTFAKTADRIVMRLTLRHWLSDLDFASTLSAASHPGNPKNLIYNPKLQFGGAGSGLTYSLVGLVQSFINPYYAAQNFWYNAIFPFLSRLVAADRINNVGGTGNDCLNRAVMRALTSWRFSLLPLDINRLGPLLVSRFVESLIGFFDQQNADAFLESLATTTLWRKLQEYAALYLFTIIPFPLYYRVEPVVLGLSRVYKTIPASEIIGITMALDRPTVPTRAVGIYANMRPLAGSAVDGVQEATFGTVGGWYISSSLGYGLVEVVRAPVYLDGAFSPAFFTRGAVGGINKKTALMRSPAIRDLGVLEIQRNSLLVHSAVLDELAHYYFITKQLMNRRMAVICPFRMDICPGSTICLQVISSEQIPMENGYLYGLVESVNYVIREDGARTIYNLVGVRNAAEYAHPDFSTLVHPFYGHYFVGWTHT